MTVTVTLPDGGSDKYMRFADVYVEHNCVDFTADTQSSKRVANFVKRDTDEQDGHHHQARTHQIWIGQQEPKGDERRKHEEDVQINRNAPPTAQGQAPALD